MSEEPLRPGAAARVATAILRSHGLPLVAELPAGRELDALVAERVMGWTALQTDTWHEKGRLGGKPPDRHFTRVPRYSTDIRAAWEVLEKVLVTNLGVNLTLIEGEWRIDDEAGGYLPSFSVAAPTAPLAICRAALAWAERKS